MLLRKNITIKTIFKKCFNKWTLNESWIIKVGYSLSKFQPTFFRIVTIIL